MAAELPLILLTAEHGQGGHCGPDPPGNAGSLLHSSGPLAVPGAHFSLRRSPLDEITAHMPWQAGRTWRQAAPSGTEQQGESHPPSKLSAVALWRSVAGTVVRLALTRACFRRSGWLRTSSSPAPAPAAC